LNAERDNQIFALPVARYEELPGLARAFARITDEIRRQALDAFMPALQARYIQLQRSRRRDFEVRITSGDEVLKALQRDGAVLHALDAASRRRIRDLALPIAREIMARLDALPSLRFSDGQVALDPVKHARLFVEVEKALDDCGALPAFGAYSGKKLGLLRLAVQVNTERETRLRFGEIDAQGLPPNKTDYFHLDSNDWPSVKALIYLSEVELDQGPFRFVKGSHRAMGDFEASVRKTNDKLGQSAEHFLSLPPEFGQHANFGGYINETTPGAAELLAKEMALCDGRSDLALFDNSGVHRGGFVRSGARFMLQCQFWHADRMIERTLGSAAAKAALQSA